MHKNSMGMTQRFLILSVLLVWISMSGGVCTWAQTKVVDKVKEGAVSYAGKVLDDQQVKYRQQLADKGVKWETVDTNMDGELDPVELVMYGIENRNSDGSIPWKDIISGILLFLSTFGYRWFRKSLGMPAGGTDHADKKPTLGGGDIVQP